MSRSLYHAVLPCLHHCNGAAPIQRGKGKATLIQVCTDVSEPDNYEREVRALADAAAEYRGATPWLLTFDTLPPRSPLPKPFRWQPAIAWLLGDELPAKQR